jgi:hypothetical protein
MLKTKITETKMKRERFLLAISFLILCAFCFATTARAANEAAVRGVVQQTFDWRGFVKARAEAL